jgi:hypothetical protein
MTLFAASGWADVERLREGLGSRGEATVRAAGQGFAADIARHFSSVVLARVFLVLPFRSLPPPDRAFAIGVAKGDSRLDERTPVLSLLGTSGREPHWGNRERSNGHLAIPLLARAHVENIPMLARLLGDLQVDFSALDDGRALASERMLGGSNAKFYVPDAQTAKNERGEFVIPAREFVKKYAVRTVFGMGGAYLDGTLAVAVIFTDEPIDVLIVNRFPSLISSFKMATSKPLSRGAIF